METLKETVRSLVALVLVAGALEMMLPQGSLRGYVRVVMGLLVMLTVLNPLLAWRQAPVAVDPAAMPELTGERLPSVAAAAARLRAAAAAATAREFRAGVARTAAELARQVPGVADARAEVNTGLVPADGAPPPVVSVRVLVYPGTASPPLVARVAPVGTADPAAAGGSRAGTELVGAVRSRVAAGLGLTADRVLVTISGR